MLLVLVLVSVVLDFPDFPVTKKALTAYDPGGPGGGLQNPEVKKYCSRST